MRYHLEFSWQSVPVHRRVDREVNRLCRNREVDLSLQRRELDDIDRKLRGLIEAVAEDQREAR